VAGCGGGGGFFPRPTLPPGFAWGNGCLEADEIDIDTELAGRIAGLRADEGDALPPMLRKARAAVAEVLNSYSLAVLAGGGRKRENKAACRRVWKMPGSRAGAAEGGLHFPIDQVGFGVLGFACSVWQGAQNMSGFEQDSAVGRLRSYDYLGDDWGVLFSHPKDYTPVCTTELAEVARLKSEWHKRNVKPVGLSVDPAESHWRWVRDIEETQGQSLDFPAIADADRTVADLYGMIHPEADPSIRVRTVFSIDPKKKAWLVLTYPPRTGRNLTEILRDRQSAIDGSPQSGNAGQERWTAGHYRSRAIRRRSPGAPSQWLGNAEALSRGPTATAA